MEKILKLYTYVDGINDIAFPSEGEQVIIPSFTYNAKRMGDAPIISFSFMHTQCLDDLWNDMVYAEFNGERYYIKQTPSSSFDNTDSRYKHSVEMVSERSVLSDVFLFDVVTKNQGEDKPASNNSNVVFFGDIHEFASRINLSLNNSRVEYRVDVPSDITSEAKLMSLNKQYISQALVEIHKTYGLFYQFDGKVIRVSKSENEIQDVFEYGSDKALISTSKNNSNKKIITRCTGVGSSDNIPYYYPNPTPYGELNIFYNGAATNNVVIFDWGRFAKCGITNTLKYSQVSVSGGDDKIYPLSKFEEYDVIDLTPITGESSYGWVGYCKFEINKSYYDVAFEIKNDFGSGYANLEIQNDDGTPVWWGNEMPENGITLSYGNYTAYVTFDVGSDDYEAETTARQYGDITLILKHTPLIKEGWVLNGVIVDLNNFGIRYAGAAEFGDEISFHQVGGSRIPVSPYLMPYIYRDTNGEEIFYHAQNDTYRDDKDEYYVFDNIYVEGRPKEDIIELEDIKPTIEGVIYNGNRIDTFVDFEYDDDDSDEVDNNGNYVHPYFFAKLNRLDFNLFAHAIEGKPMTIAMTSGSCGACQWTIGVDDNTQANLVQVDANGNLLRDNNGNVRCGRAGTQREIAQAEQNDTVNNEVWIALKKEYNTFGIIMPNKANNYKPGIGDTFVILNINLPHSYIVNAEQRLTEAIIKHMYDNNAEKFNFGIKFSRIYLQEHEDVLKNLNENSAINIKYNGRKFTLHTSSYTYKITANEALPEISLELSDEISISNGTIRKAISKVETDVEKVGKKTLAEVQNISEKKANKSTTLEGYGITDAYTRTEAAEEFISTRADTDVSGIKNFTDGFKIGGILIKYDASKDALEFTTNVIINKGLAWNSRLENFSDEEIFTITKAVNVDGQTIKKDPETGALYAVSSGTGGGFDETQLADYLTKNKYITESALQSYAKTTDLDKYLLRAGGKITGELQITKGEDGISGGYLYFGDRGYVYITEDIEDHLSIYADRGIDLSTGGNYSVKINGSAVVTEEYVSSVLTDYAPLSAVPTNNNQLTNGAGYITGISSQMVTNALGYTPFSASGGHISGDIQIQGSTIMYSRPTINTTEKSNILLQINGKLMGAVGYTTGNGSVALWNETAQTIFQLRDDGLAAMNCSLTAPKFYGDLEGSANRANAINWSDGAINLYDHLTAHDVNDWQIMRGAEPIIRVANAGLVISPYDKTSGFIALRTGDVTITTGAKEIRLLANGNFGVGIAAPEQKLHVNGNILATGRIAWNSSRVLKNIIDERYLTLDEMLRMKPYTYTWKDGRDRLIHVGAIADDIKPILPETVLTDSKDIHSMDYAQTAYVMCASLARELAIVKAEISKPKGVA